MSMKKIIVYFLTVVCSITCVCFAACKDEKSSSSSDSQESQELVVNDYFANNQEETDIEVQEIAYIRLNKNEQGVTIGDFHRDEIVIKGTAQNAQSVLTVKGNGLPLINAGAGCTLVFKNLKIVNQGYLPDSTAVRTGYLGFGGDVRFENCTFEGAYAYAVEDSQIEFTDCVFISKRSSMYALWVAGGEVALNDCTFTGFRGVKIHEENTDVISVSLERCQFEGLTEKTGVVIGDIVEDIENTVISIRDCMFDGCRPWDKIGSLEGIDGFYESDTDTAMFDFISADNLVDGMSSEDLDKEVNPNYNK